MTGAGAKKTPLLLTGALLLLAACSLTPFAWLLCAALKSDADAYRYAFLPWRNLDRLTLSHFADLFRQQSFARWLINSIFLASTTSLLTVLLSSAAGFALAKYSFAGKRILMSALIVTMLLPPQVMLGSLYELMNRLGWIDSYLAILAPGAASVFGAFLFKQAMANVPDELIDAARLDGCSECRIWWEIALPIVRPMTAAYALMSFLASWNSFLWPQIVLQTQSKYTLPIALNNMVGLQLAQHDLGIVMAGAVVSIVPIAILFFAMQGDFIAGLASGAMKR